MKKAKEKMNIKQDLKAGKCELSVADSKKGKYGIHLRQQRDKGDAN